jgi:hypothetical protein
MKDSIRRFVSGLEIDDVGFAAASAPDASASRA